MSRNIVFVVVLCLFVQPLAFGAAVATHESIAETTPQQANLPSTTDSMQPAKTAAGTTGSILPPEKSENTTETGQNDNDTAGQSVATSLTIELYTTRGDVLTGFPNVIDERRHAQGQDVDVEIEYSGLPPDGGEIAVVDYDPVVSNNEFERITVSDSSGVVTVRLSYEELRQVAEEFGEAGGPDVEAQWVRSGNVEETSNRITVFEVDTTIYIEDYPDSVPVGESATVDVYGWSQYDFVNGELYWDCGTLCEQLVANNPDIQANPAFEDTITLTPSNHASAGETMKVRAHGSKDTSTYSRWVSIDILANDQPTASFTVSPNPATVGETVSFDGSGSTDPDGSITAYEWDFDNDGTIDATGATPTHSFDAPGDYPVSLTVTDDDGATDTETITVSVRETDSAITATRTIVRDEAQPGATITVTVDVTLEEAASFEIDDGFDPAFADVEIVDADDASFAAAENDRAVARYGSLGDDPREEATLVYEVTIPEDATIQTTYDFSGTVFADSEATITGDDTVTVRDVAWYDPYVDENDVATLDGALNAIDDYESGDLSLDRVLIIIDSYETGTPVPDLIDEP